MHRQLLGLEGQLRLRGWWARQEARPRFLVKMASYERGAMHIVVGRLSGRYSGRGDSYLPPHDRIVLLKQDSSVSIHNEKGFKPLNYMMAPTVLTQEKDAEGNLLWRFQGKGEMLEIIFHKIYDEVKNTGHQARCLNSCHQPNNLA